MLYTITTRYKADRLYVSTDRIEAETPQEAKEIASRGILESDPDAKITWQRAQKSHKTPT